MVSRGIRNNNPFNVRRTSSRWFGLSKEQTDKSFCQFDSMLYGVRAGLYIIRQYDVKYNIRTVQKIIERFAPPCENDVTSYVNYVCDMLLTPKTLVGDKNTLFNLSSEMCLIESKYYLSYKLFSDAYNLLPNNLKFKNE